LNEPFLDGERRLFLVPLQAFGSEDGARVVNSVVAIPLAGSLPGSSRLGASAAARARFVAGPENRLALAALDDVLGGRPTSYSPLVFYGPASSGKSHLAAGLAAAWRERHGAELVAQFTGREFVDGWAAACRLRRVDAWRREIRAASLFVLDDLAPLAMRKGPQHELCQTLDALEESGALAVVTCRALPGQLPGLAPALVGRLSAGLATPLALPGAAARRMIVEALAAARRLPITREAAHLFADGIAASVDALAKALVELEAASAGREIDVAAAQAFLSQSGGADRPTLRSIALQTAKYFRLTLAELKSPARRQALVLARGVAFVLMREMTDKSLEQIGAYFGGRDHTTVLHACRRTEKLAKRDATIQQVVADLRRRLA
jgi:chromosomal replication initiator protein